MDSFPADLPFVSNPIFPRLECKTEGQSEKKSPSEEKRIESPIENSMEIPFDSYLFLIG